MRKSLRTIGMMVAISFRADPVRSVAAVATATGQMVSVPVRAVGLRDVTNGIIAHHAQLLFAGVGLVVGLTAINRVMAWASLNVRMRLRENTELWLDSELIRMTTAIPGIEHHENPRYLDRVELLRADRGYLANPFNPISWSVSGLIQLATILVLLAGVHPLLPLLPLTAVFSVWATIASQRALMTTFEAQAQDQRRVRHLYELATEARAGKEVRVFGLARELVRRHAELTGRLERELRAVALRRIARETLGWVFFGAGFAAALAFTVQLAVAHTVSVGDVALVVSIGTMLNSQLAATIQSLRWFVRKQRAVARYVWLTDYAEAAHAAATPRSPRPVPATIRDGITVSDVSFTYSGAESPALEEISVSFQRGSIVAIVGENGAGKTTLVKLLSRFYIPTRGAITVDGVDLADFDPAEWHAHISAGFQDFVRWEFLARESVGLGDLEQIDNDHAITAALGRASADDLPGALPRGLDTQLGRTFAGGVDLSMGQWQKVALGRSMMREAPLLLLLDEPTASLDAQTEHALFERFTDAARRGASQTGAITVIVSHRFSTVRMADLIIVLKDGRLVESGGHAQLMGAGGLYAELFTMQARAYR